MASAGIGDRVEGVHAVGAAVAAGRVRRLTVERSRLRDQEIAALVQEARAAGCEIVEVDDVSEFAVTQAPQGLVAEATPLPRADIADLVPEAGSAAILVLDHLQDPRNLGAIARTAVAAGFGGLVVPTRRAAPVGATAFKAAAGALEHLQLATVSSIASALDRLRAMDVWLVGLDAHGERSIFGLDLLKEPVALVVGAEARGLGRLVRDKVDVVASIPHVGSIESLNASVAASLAMYELARMRGWVT